MDRVYIEPSSTLFYVVLEKPQKHTKFKQNLERRNQAGDEKVKGMSIKHLQRKLSVIHL